ncbi:MAG: transcriptional regulator, LuxR family-like protein [Ramlibacter sp.]|jgi:LuxR family quorum-sensing system transcriptional regulator SolR|nr:transcriptional regulator, LuxR family-like protein [Ramlibacter sp.]
MVILSQPRQKGNEMALGVPANFDSVSLDGILSDWIGALREFSVEAVVILGPDPFGGSDDRQVVAVHPPVLADAAQALAQSRDFGAPWRDSDAPLVAWQYIAKSDHLGTSRWRQLWLAHGYQTVVRVEFSLPAGRAFECFMFSPRELTDRGEAASLVWSAMNIWPLVKRSIAQARSTLSPRERECLVFAFGGLTARETSLRLSCTERTVNYHLANAMGKLKVDNKMAAIQRACWVGAI